MTLILTAICKDGISICADRRYKITDSGGSVRNEDNHNKIYEFEQIPYVILNHGINKIDNKDWKIYCSDYKNLGSWKGKNHFQIVNDFKEYIEGSVRKELSRYKDREKHAMGFLLGGKPPTEDKYKVTEIHWLQEDGEIKPTTSPVHTYKKDNLIITGSDDIKDYLIKYIESNHAQYSNISKIRKAEERLVTTFELAVKVKPTLRSNEFSDDYVVKSVRE